MASWTFSNQWHLRLGECPWPVGLVPLNRESEQLPNIILASQLLLQFAQRHSNIPQDCHWVSFLDLNGQVNPTVNSSTWGGHSPPPPYFGHQFDDLGLARGHLIQHGLQLISRQWEQALLFCCLLLLCYYPFLPWPGGLGLRAWLHSPPG